MPFYQTRGEIPRKRHSVYRQPDGGLYSEELVGNKGFSGPSSLLYHLRPPTRILGVRQFPEIPRDPCSDRLLKHRHFRTALLQTGPSPVTDRIQLLMNSDVGLLFANPREEDGFFYRNGQADEIVYISSGIGTLETQMGELRFGPGDYLVIPRGILHKYRLGAGPVRLLIIESAGYVRTPKRYRNELGQLTENSPYSERDIRTPEFTKAHDEEGEFRILVRKDNQFSEIILGQHPFDVVGWDGYYFPWAFNIANFEPRVGRFHLPPPVHQTFEGDGFVVCSFCPRPYDFDKQSVPAPYNHSNVMSDEVLYYANSEFMSRKGIEYGSITLHPDGIPHGPHPGRTEASIGAKQTDELAVMLDTFRPLQVTKQAALIEDGDYFRSWLEDGGH